MFQDCKMTLEEVNNYKMCKIQLTTIKTFITGQ